MAGGDDVSEEALEAELLALQGKAPAKGKKAGSKGMSMKDIDTMVAGLDGMGEEVRRGGEGRVGGWRSEKGGGECGWACECG